VVSFPTELDIVITHHFDASRELVFDVFTQPEHVRQTFATYGEEFKVCDIDLRVGGGYHFVLVPENGVECSFRGTYVEVDPPRRTVATWSFDGWPGVEAVETVEFAESANGTGMTWKQTFRDLEGRRRITTTRGTEANFESIDRYLTTLRRKP